MPRCGATFDENTERGTSGGFWEGETNHPGASRPLSFR